jgi:hopanoid biosynthesis associated RND transporter like protein HpnN
MRGPRRGAFDADASRRGVALSESFEARVDAFAARWVAAVDRRPARVVAGVLLATALLGIYAARNLGVNADPNAMIAEDLPFRVRERDYLQTFRVANDDMLVVVDGESASAAGNAAEAIATRLRARTDLFEKVQLAGGGEFFRRNALLYLDLPVLEELADRLAAVQPFLAEIARDPSVAGIADLLAKAIDAARDGTDVGMDLTGALDKVRVGVDAAAEGRTGPDPWGDALIGGSMSEDARHRVIGLLARSDFDELMFAEPAIQAVRDVVRELGFGPESGIRVRLTGATVLNYEELEVVEVQGRLLALAALVLFTAAVYFALRSWRVLLALVVSLVTSLVWSNAFAAAVVGHLNQVSATFNVLIIGLGGELGIHVCMRYAELVAQGRSRPAALAGTGGTMGSALFSSAVTTAIGFLVFYPTDYRGVAELGLIASAGVLFSLVSSLTLLPALLSLGAPRHPRFAAAARPAIAELRHLPIVWARPIRWAALALALGSLAFLPRARFDHNPVNLRDPHTESVQAFEDLLRRSSTSPWTVEWVVDDLDEARTLAARLDELPVVERTLTLHSFVPEQQDEKRAVLDTIALLVPLPLGDTRAPDAAAQTAALERLERAAAAHAGAGDPLAIAAARLRDALARFRGVLAGSADPAPRLAVLQANVVGSLPQQLDELVDSLEPDVVTLESIPPELRETMLAADGRARVTAFPRQGLDLGQPADLDHWVLSALAVDARGTGPAVNILEWGRVTSGAMQQAMLLGFVATALFLFLLWRNLWDTTLAFFPLGLAGLLTCTVMVLAGWHFDFANVIVLPMLLGMGIDNGVHLVHRHRTNPEEEDVLASSTARAVFFAALTTILAFGSLAFAPHRGMASLGRMLTLGVGLTLLCYVVVLPAVLAWDDQRVQRKRTREAQGSASEADTADRAEPAETG